MVVTLRDSFAVPGGIGFFDVVVDNPTAASIDIGGFSFDLAVPPGSGVLFTGVTTNPTTNSYIFAGTGIVDFLGVPFSADAFPNSSFIAADAAFLTTGETLNPGDTFALGRVFFSLDSGTPSGTAIAVSLGQFTDLSDPLGAPIAFSSVNGTITAVPEPSSWALGTLLTVGWSASRLRRRARPAEAGGKGGAG